MHASETHIQATIAKPVVKNVKFHFKVLDIRKLNLNISNLIDLKINNIFPKKDILNIKHNFLVYKRTFVYIVFFNKGFVNCTKVRSYSQIGDCVTEFCDIFNFNYIDCIPPIVVDNSTSSGDFQQKIDLRNLQQLINNNNNNNNNTLTPSLTTKFNPEHFPGLFLKHSVGTLLLFYSGKYSIVGTKCQQQTNTLHSLVHVYIKML
jgi:TATA-box binding protein (TBP) (component of TFIID and TFIIIB)